MNILMITVFSMVVQIKKNIEPFITNWLRMFLIISDNYNTSIKNKVKLLEKAGYAAGATPGNP